MDRQAVQEIFEHLEANIEGPKTELDYINPFTLLVAVVLSAQMTDAGVNRATVALFEAADTPQAMLDLGENAVLGFIAGINFKNTKARSVIALSRLLIDRHGGQVPHDRAALEALPGVGRKTANVVLNVAFGEKTIAVDTHVLRVSKPYGPRTRQDARGCGDGPDEDRARPVPAGRASPADPARPLCVQGAAARLPAVRHPRLVRVPGQDDSGDAGEKRTRTC